MSVTLLQEGLNGLFSKFGTSPEDLLKEEQSWTNGVQEVRPRVPVSCCINFCFRFALVDVAIRPCGANGPRL